jgi:microcystin-dependent protein
MGQSFVGEIRMVGFSFPPVGWAFCSGQTIPISQNDVLFTLIGTTYGGDGQETFNLPNLQSRMPLHQGNKFGLGEMGGVESVTLTTQQMPSHTHQALCQSGDGTQANPQGNVWASSPATPYSNTAPDTTMNGQALAPVGGNQPHDNMMPYLAISFIISLFGIFPTPT